MKVGRAGVPSAVWVTETCCMPCSAARESSAPPLVRGCSKLSFGAGVAIAMLAPSLPTAARVVAWWGAAMALGTPAHDHNC